MKFDWKPIEYYAVFETEKAGLFMVYMRRLYDAEPSYDADEEQKDMWSIKVNHYGANLDINATLAWDSARPGQGRAEMAIIHWLKSKGVDIDMDDVTDLTWVPYDDSPIEFFDPDTDEDDGDEEAEEVWLKRQNELAAENQKRAWEMAEKKKQERMHAEQWPPPKKD